MKQIELARLCNVTQSTVSAWEGDKAMPELDKLQIMADHFKTSIDYIVNGDASIALNNAYVSDDEQVMLARYRSLNDEDKELLRAEALRMKRANSAQIAGAS